MSLYSALYAGVSGLNAQSNAMATVADNITNVNTIGYKAVIADFSTLVGGGGGGAGSSDYSAGGVQSIAKQTISHNGLLQAATNNSDIGVDGNGFFIVRNGTSADSQIAYTRAGSFTPDRNGNLLNTGGYYLQGWPIDANGKVSDNPNDLQTVNMYALSGTAEATSNMTTNFNLQSTTDKITGTYTAGDMAKYAADPNASPPVGTAPQFTRSLDDVYDQQGNPHHLSIGFVKTDTNKWQVEVYGDDLDPSIANGVLASGTVAFKPDGTLDLANTDASLLNADKTGFKDLSPTWNNGAGAEPIKLNLGLTQTSDVSSQGTHTVNGGLLGNVTDVNIATDGTVSAVFENGSTRPIYKLPLATFANPNGLTTVAGNAYEASDDSGGAAINVAGTQGTGQIDSKKLEASTADIATEFTNMIRFQRAYSASSKIITTVDQMLQELGNLKG